MKRFILFIPFVICLLNSSIGISQDTNTIELHLQVYDNGICTPMLKSNFYSTSQYQKTKRVLQSGSYRSNIYTCVNSLDSGNLNPQTNHQLQSSSLLFNPKLDYEIVFLRYDGYDLNNPDSMIIKVSNLDVDAQVILPFKEGVFTLKKMKFFKKLKPNALPDFISEGSVSSKNELKLDSTAYFSDGRVKTNYFAVSDNFPVYYVQEFDSINPSFYSRGYRLISNYNQQTLNSQQSIWANPDNTKYGYWEYFENGKRVKHEMWMSVLQEKYEWYPSGKLKFISHYGHYNKEKKHVFYLENGSIMEEFHFQTKTRRSFIKSYEYSSLGKIILINTYNSINGITKQGLQKREVFYPSGKLKMMENFTGGYQIKYYNEDGTERIN